MKARFVWLAVLLLVALVGVHPVAQNPPASNGLGVSMGNLSRLSHAKSRSISPENFTGEKGKAGMATDGTGAKAARDLGQGWKISPSVRIKAGETFVMGEIQGQGAIQHIWMTPTGNWRYSILRMYWDGEAQPSVEVPVGDFFASGWGGYAPMQSLAVCVNPGSGLNAYWEMPFRKSAKITMQNLADADMTLYYQLDYTLTDVPADAAYFHAQFRRSNPLPYKSDYTILDGIKGWGHYVGTYLAWGVHNTGWWGEGEIKFFIDGDAKFPTICGTGTEDYFCGSYNFENPETRQYQVFNTPYSGLLQVQKPDGVYRSQQRFGLYRWHIADPVRFEQDLRVTIQALGWRDGGRYLPLQDDIASVGYWYQTEPHAAFPKLPDRDTLEVK
ncbi:MAG: glycoside hydrolase family 172 protein [Bacteroidales bacterium]